MERITSNQVVDLMEAYRAVYVPQEDLNEEVIWEEVENWVNSLLEEGYDLSEYSWEEMYEEYLNEKVSADPYGVSPGTRKVTSSVPVRPRPPSRGGSSDPYGASGAAGAPVRPKMSADPYGVSPGTKRVGGGPVVRPPSRGGSSDPYGASGAARPTGAAPVRPKIGSLPTSARQVTQYPQGVSTGVGGGNAGASRPSAAPARPVARPSAAPAPNAPRPAAGTPARPVARPSAAPAPNAPRPAAGAPNIAKSTSQAPGTSPAATTGNPPLRPKPLPPIMGKPSLSSQAAELRAMRQRSQQRTIAQGGTPATALVQSFDPFDVVLGHLIDEGYADNEESALQIMTNMSEEWRDDILDEAMMDGPRKDKMIAKQHSPYVSSRDRATAFNVGVRDDRPRDKKSTGGKGERYSDFGDRGAGNKSRRRQGLEPIRGNTRKEEVDLYDAILSHLIDEGYADNEESALQIMTNMSEEWRDDILDEAKTVMSVTSPSGKRRELNISKAKPSKNLEGQERLSAARDIRQKDVDRRAPEIEKRIKRRHNIH